MLTVSVCADAEKFNMDKNETNINESLKIFMNRKLITKTVNISNYK